MAAHGLEQHLEVARRVLGRPEGPAGHRPGRVVDPADQGERRPPALQPVVPGAIGLEKHAHPGHPRSPAPVGRGPSGPRRSHAGLGEDPLDRPGRGDGGVELGQRLAEVDRVEPCVRRERLVHDRRPDQIGDPVGRLSPAIAVDQARGSLRSQPVSQSMHLADRQAKVRGGIAHIELARKDMGEHQEALLCPGIQRDRLPLLHGPEGDKVAVALGRTKSLSSDMVGPVDADAGSAQHDQPLAGLGGTGRG